MISECLKLGNIELLKIQFRGDERHLPDFHKYAVKSNGCEIAMNSQKNIVELYKSSGEFIKNITISNGDVAELSWSYKDGLLEIVYSDGRFHALATNYEDYTEIYILDDALNTGELVLEAKFVKDDFISVLTSDNNFISFDLSNMNRINYIKPELLDFNSPQCWFPTTDGSIVFGLNSSVFKLTNDNYLLQKNFEYDIVCHASGDDDLVEALFLTSDGRLIVLNIETFELILDVNIKDCLNVYSVNAVTWVNNDSSKKIAALICSSSGKITLVDLLEGKFCHLLFPKNFFFFKERDGLRILQNGQNWLITLLPEEMKKLTQNGSKAGKLHELFMTKDFDSIEAMSNVEISEAIDSISTILLNISFEPDLLGQTINAGAFAVKCLEKSLGHDQNSMHTFSYVTANFNRAVNECSVLKKLNDFGLEMSPQQFRNSLKDEKILRILNDFDNHNLALEIGVKLELDLADTLMDWTRKMIKESKLDENGLWNEISDKLFTWSGHNSIKNRGNLDFIGLSELSIECDKPKLAGKILKLEKSTKRKIELLVKLNQYRDAVIESVNSGKQDQITYIFDFLSKRLSLLEFFNLANISKAVEKALRDYCKNRDKCLNRILMYQDDLLDDLIQDLIISSDSPANDLENLENWFNLLRTQRIFEHKYGKPLMGTAMTESLQEISKNGSKAARDFSESIK